jgi:probable H4MPT-linked C1 transfer pathway protein
MLKTKYRIGWDIGGAHLKAALLDAEGVALQVHQLACPLWRGLNALENAMMQMRQLLDTPDALSLVTMTGELVDLFPNRHTGVCEIASVVNQQLGPQALFYSSECRWISFSEVSANTPSIASMNWHASARFLAKCIDRALFIDIGSTTTDMIPLQQHLFDAVGQTDAQRMSNHALIYTGVVRTPLMAFGQTISFKDQIYYLAAEYFSTSADVYRMLQQLPETADLADTADGKGKTLPETARRLARMVGHDLEDYPMSDWVTLAQSFKQLQKNLLMQAIRAHTHHDHMPIVAAGIGAFLCQELAQDLHLPVVNVSKFVQANDSTTHLQAVNCFPAYAVARLAD